MSKTRAKFWPSSCDVPICSALPSRIMPFARHRVDRAGEALARGLAPDEDRDGEHLDHEVFVRVVQDARRVPARVLLGRVRGVALLPEELAACAGTGACAAPSARCWPTGSAGAGGRGSDCTHFAMYSPMTVSLVGRTTIGSSSSLPPRVRDDRELGAEALDVLGFALEVVHRDEQREVRVLAPARLDAVVDLAPASAPRSRSRRDG